MRAIGPGDSRVLEPARVRNDAEVARHYRDNPGELIKLEPAEQRTALRAMQRDRARWKQTAAPEQVAWAERNRVFDLYTALGRS